MEHEISLGGSLNSGNTNSYAAQLKEISDRTTLTDQFHFGVLGDFKRVEHETVSDRAKGEFQYNHQISGQLYGFGRGSAETDEILDLTYRLQAGPGVGYFVIKSDKITFALEAVRGAQA